MVYTEPDGFARIGDDVKRLLIASKVKLPIDTLGRTPASAPELLAPEEL